MYSEQLLRQVNLSGCKRLSNTKVGFWGPRPQDTHRLPLQTHVEKLQWPCPPRTLSQVSLLSSGGSEPGLWRHLALILRPSA